MKKTLLTLVLGLVVSVAFAQDKTPMQKIEAARIALITERLELSPEQAEKFWPIYREYADQRKALMSEMKNIRNEAARQNISEEEGRRLMDMAHQLKEKELNLDQQYSDRLMNVISARQMMSLRKAEEDFRKMLLRQIERRQEQRMTREQLRQRRESLKQRQGN